MVSLAADEEARSSERAAARASIFVLSAATRGWGRQCRECAAPGRYGSRVRGLQQRRHRAPDDDLAADHFGPLDVEIAELSTDELKRPLV